jgi:hypothetical protein
VKTTRAVFVVGDLARQEKSTAPLVGTISVCVVH